MICGVEANWKEIESNTEQLKENLEKALEDNKHSFTYRIKTYGIKLTQQFKINNNHMSGGSDVSPRTWTKHPTPSGASEQVTIPNQ